MRYFRKKSGIRKRAYRRKPRAVRGKKFAKAVRRVIQKTAEVKTAVLQVDNSACNSGIDVAGDFRNIMPFLTQSVTEGGRIGNRVTMKGLYVKGHVMASAIANTTSLVDKLAGTIPPNARLGVRIMVVASRKFVGLAGSYTNVADYLLNLGSTQVGFAGNTRDLYADICRDTVKVYYDKVIYINTPIMYNMNTTAPNGTTSQDVAANTMGSVKFFRFKIPGRARKLIFNDATNDPVNFQPHLCLGYVHLDGSSPDVLTTAVKLSYVSKLYFTDI